MRKLGLRNELLKVPKLTGDEAGFRICIDAEHLVRSDVTEEESSGRRTQNSFLVWIVEMTRRRKSITDGVFHFPVTSEGLF